MTDNQNILKVNLIVGVMYSTLSAIVGWVAFNCENDNSLTLFVGVLVSTLKFYVSVEGLSFDFLVANLVGFGCYTLFISFLFFNQDIQNEYQKRHQGQSSLVQWNDLFFSWHALILVTITLLQAMYYRRTDQGVSTIIFNLLWSLLLLSLILIVIAALKVIDWLDFLYFLSFVKLATSLIKYIPQAIMNWKRKSTVGWSIVNVILDFSGGLLSNIQLFMDAAIQQDWSGIIGYPAKFGLGLTSILFDVIFLIQHYVLYPKAEFVPLIQEEE